jgi:hypothetical protein
VKRTPLARKTPLTAKTGIKRTKRIKVAGTSETADLKVRIQELVREIVIKRDGGCILRNICGIPACNGYRKSDGELILQADHLITRANSATYADTRLIVCVCQGHHGWKKWHKEEYDALVKSVIGGDRAMLWARCEEDSWRPNRTSAYDWRLHVAALEQELRGLQ